MKYWVLFLLISSSLFFTTCQTKDLAAKKIEALCLSESEKIAGMSEGLIDYCACAAPKILERVKDDKAIMAKFDQGEFNHIISNIKDSTFTAVLNNCMNGDKFVYNPPTMEFLLPERAERSIRVTLIDEMSAEFKERHNMDQYCDCYIHSIKTKLTFEEFHARNLEEMPKYKALLKDCAKKSAR